MTITMQLSSFLCDRYINSIGPNFKAALWPSCGYTATLHTAEHGPYTKDSNKYIENKDRRAWSHDVSCMLPTLQLSWL